MRGKMREVGRMTTRLCMVSDVEGVRSLGGTGALRSKRDVIGVSSDRAWRSLVSNIL